MSEINTKNKILDTAEKLYAVEGFGATSLRAIIKQAGVNTAAVHYHFGSREGLIEAILRRRAEPINAERLRLIDAVENAHPSGTLPLAAVVEAFLAPAIRIRFERPQEIALFPQLMARATIEPDDKIRVIIHDVFSEVIERFMQAFMRALPELSLEEVQWRIHFMIGAMAFTVLVPKLAESDQVVAEGSDAKQIVDSLVTFVSAGMRGSITQTAGKDDR